MRLKFIAAAIATLVVSFIVSIKAMDIWSAHRAAPALTTVAPLPPVTQTSIISTPIEITLTAIQDALDRSTPKTFSGKAPNPAPSILKEADIGWTATRGTIVATGAQNALTLVMPLNGKLNVKGSLSADVRSVLGGAVGQLFGSHAAKQVGSINIRQLNASADIHGAVSVLVQPSFKPDWRIDPNLVAQVDLGDSTVSVGGVEFGVPAQIKPAIDNAIGQQLAGIRARISNDPAFENSARREWNRMCRSIRLQTMGSPLPPLWLEVRPIRAVASQPRVDNNAMTITLAVEAQTRVTATETRPNCPFPTQLQIADAAPAHVGIAVPIELSFAQVNDILNSQLAGRRFPDRDGVTLRHVAVRASGNRLLIALQIDGGDSRWASLGAGSDDTVYIWCKPQLDRTSQILRLANLELSVESKSAISGAIAAAIPFIQTALAEQVTIDLNPYTATARKRIAGAIADFQVSERGGVHVNAQVTAMRLGDIAFDSKTLRVIAEAEGVMKVTLSELPGL